MEGATEEDIGRLLNHKTRLTTRSYMHRTDERLQELAKKVSIEVKEKEAPPPPPPVIAVGAPRLRLVQ